MLGHAFEPVHGGVAQPRPQSLDELRQVLAGLTPVVREEFGGVGLQVDERTAQQAHVAHRLWQHEPRQALAQQLGHALRLCADRLHETQPHPRDRIITMTQLRFDGLHAATAFAQEPAQLVEQRLQGVFEARGVADLGFEIAPGRIPF